MLNEQKCEACSLDAIAPSKDEQQSLLLQLSDWQIIERGGGGGERRCDRERTRQKEELKKETKGNTENICINSSMKIYYQM